MDLKTLFDDEAQGADLEKTGKMLLILASMGMPGAALAEMLDFATGGKLHKDHKLFLAAPIIQHQSQWRESTPAWLYEAVAYDRLQIVLEEHKSGQVGWAIGPTELTTVLYPATMEAPMRHEYAQIYLWAAAQANARHYSKPVEFFWEKVGGFRVKDEDVLSPKGQYHYAYRELCADVRRKAVALQVENERALNRQKKDDLKVKPKPDIQGRQLDLF